MRYKNITKAIIGLHIEDYLHEVNMGEERKVKFILKKKMGNYLL